MSSDSAPVQLNAKDFASQAKAKNTVRAYRTDWNHFCAWCQDVGAKFLPASPETVALYLSAHVEVFKVSTLERRLVAIGQAHRLAEKDDPTSSKLMMLRDEIKKAEMRVRQIRELRERKLSLLAVLKANGGAKKELEMTPEEEALFKDMVKVLRSHKDVLWKAKKKEEYKPEKQPEPKKEAEGEVHEKAPAQPEPE